METTQTSPHSRADEWRTVYTYKKTPDGSRKMDNYFMQQLRGILTTRSGEEIKLPKNMQRMTLYKLRENRLEIA